MPGTEFPTLSTFKIQSSQNLNAGFESTLKAKAPLENIERSQIHLPLNAHA
jgi:hypothetical protein